MWIKKYDNSEVFIKKAEEYFEKTPTKDQTKADFCVFMGISTALLSKYKSGGQGDEFQEAAEWVYTRLERKWEADLNYKANPTGPIFALKQYGWRDSQEVDAKVSGFEVVCNVPRPTEK